MKKAFKFLIVLLVVAGIVMGALYLWRYVKEEFLGPSAVKDRIISESVARRAAAASIAKTTSWDGAELGEYHTYYDLENVPSAYMYSVNRYGKKVGYVTISASTRFLPEVENSIATYLPSQKLHKLAADKGMFNNRSANDIKTELIYVGSIKYYGRHTVRDGDETKVDYYFLNPKEPEEVDLKTIETLFKTYKESRTDGAEKIWNEFIN